MRGNYIGLIVFCAFGVFLMIVSSLRPIGFDFDSPRYYELVSYYSNSLEISFYLVTLIGKYFFFENEQVVRFVLVFYALANIIILMRAIYKIVGFSTVSIIMYFFLSFAMLTLTQIRFGLGVAFFLYALSDLLDFKKNKFILKILLGGFFHYSILMALPLVFLSKKKINIKFYIILPLISLVLLSFGDYFLNSLINGISYLSGYLAIKLKAYTYSKIDQAMPLVNILSFLFFVTYYVMLFFTDVDKNSRLSILVKVFGWLIAMYFSLNFLEVFSKRILFGLSVIFASLFPLVLCYFRQRILVCFLVLSYALLYFINLTVRHGLLDYSLLVL